MNNGTDTLALPEQEVVQKKKKKMKPETVLGTIRRSVVDGAPVDREEELRQDDALDLLPAVAQNPKFRAKFLEIRRLIVKTMFRQNNRDAAAIAFQELDATVTPVAEGQDANMDALNDWMTHVRGIAAIIREFIGKLDGKERMEFVQILGSVHGRIDDIVTATGEELERRQRKQSVATWKAQAENSAE